MSRGRPVPISPSRPFAGDNIGQPSQLLRLTPFMRLHHACQPHPPASTVLYWIMAGSFNRFPTTVAGLLDMAADALTATKLVSPSLHLLASHDRNPDESVLTPRRHYGTRGRRH